MCKPSIRQCPVCGFIRAYAYTNCSKYVYIQKIYAQKQMRTPLKPHDCPDLEAPDDIWLFPYPALQCGNKECPSLRHKKAVQAQCYRVAAEKERRKAERERLEREELKRKQEAFARKWFRKIPVLSVEEQDKAWEEMMDAKGKAEAEMIRREI